MRRFALVMAALALAAAVARADWNPQAFSGEQTLEFLTVENGDQHWSTVWLVVIDGQVYIRLGSRAAGRMEGNATKPYVQIRIAGQTFPKVKAESVPDMAGPVAKAMADKYWSDVFVRYFSHPLTMRLTAETP
ncbi:MAG: hypothetical protein U0802_02505 [Candidatus Binatia bacterium]